jgi:hypothetical protein
VTATAMLPVSYSRGMEGVWMERAGFESGRGEAKRKG